MTWQGAFHHIMNKGLNDEKIFSNKELKLKYLEMLEEKSKKNKIKIFAYCIMDNHYHLVLENSSSRLSAFMRNMNSQYGFYYRKVRGGKGYVFQDRFKSILIQNESYLLNAIIYVIQNPVKARIVKRFNHYNWSSGALYFSETGDSFIDTDFVEELFINRKNFLTLMENSDLPELEVRRSRFGPVLGDEAFAVESEKKYDRRTEASLELKGRQDDQYLQPIEKIIYEFQNKYGIEIRDIDTGTFHGKRLRGEFLVQLKDRGGLTYREVKDFDLFGDLSFGSLGSLYFHTKKKKN